MPLFHELEEDVRFFGVDVAISEFVQLRYA